MAREEEGSQEIRSGGGRGAWSLSRARALAQGGPGLAGPTGARAQAKRERFALEIPTGLALKRVTPSPVQISVEQKLAALEQRLHELHGELSEQAEAIAALGERDLSAQAELLAAHACLRDGFGSLQQRCAQLRKGLPVQPVAADDF